LHANDFQRRCIAAGGLRPIATLADRAEIARQQRELAEQCIAAAEILVGTRAEQRAIGQAYFAMEHKVNELLAHHGFEAKDHACSEAALDVLLKRPGLARRLGDSYKDRKKFDYTHDPRDLRTGQALADLVSAARAFMIDVEALLPR
jgi:uncharacterized protein (UPF0332 family)